jgi:hypothetical protein
VWYDEIQAEYERICQARADKRSVWTSWQSFKGVLMLVGTMVSIKWEAWRGRDLKMEAESTVLINAAIVHGPRDEKRHEPIVVDFYT